MIRALLVCAMVSGCAAAAVASPVQVPAPIVSAYAGAKIVIARDTSNPLAGMELFVRAGLDRQTPAQNGLAALVAESILGTPVTNGRPLQDAILAQGGSITYTVDGRWIRFYVEGMQARFASAVLPLFAQALGRPDFSATAVAAARAQLNKKILENQKIPLTVGMEMLNAAFFTESDAGLPQFGLPATLAGLTGADAQHFYSTFYRRGEAVASAVGAISGDSESALRAVLDVLPAGATLPVPVKIQSLRGTEHHLVTHRDIAVPWLVAQFPAPSIGSPDFGAMLVLASFLERSAADAAENPSVTTHLFADRAAGVLYNFDDRPANLVLYINGGFGDPTRPFNTALAVVQIFARSRVAGDIGTMKSIAAGSYIDGATTLEDRAWLGGVFASQDQPPDYVTRALDAIGSVRAADLQRVARKYLANPNVAIVLPRDLQSTPS